MSSGQGGEAGTARRKQRCWSQARDTLKRRRGGRHSIKDKVHTAVANECMDSEKGVKCSKITFFPCKINIPRSEPIT